MFNKLTFKAQAKHELLVNKPALVLLVTATKMQLKEVALVAGT
jgi:hypothetical protein